MDFTLNTLRGLLTALHDSGYLFLSVKEFSDNKVQPTREVDHITA